MPDPQDGFKVPGLCHRGVIMGRQYKLRTVFFLCAMAFGSSLAAPSVTNLFSNSMVLQRAAPVPVWGKASPGETVTVTFNDQSRSADADASGEWRIVLDSMAAGGPFEMTIAGESTITISDVYVGEVWQCAGQSNMDTRVSYYKHYKDIQNSYANPMLRYYTIRQPGGRVTKWEKCTTPALVGDLSCMGFFFGRELQEKLDTVAVGLIVTAVGGTTIASWLDPATLSANPDILSNDNTAGTMFNTWVAPVVGCALAGTVLIQGEQDRSAALAPYYHERFPLLVTGWREAWGIGEFPFYWVQLANYGNPQSSPSEAGTTAQIREVQRLGLSIPNTAMAVAIDIGDSLHFGNKQEAGHRLALIARARDYGESDLVYSGPLFIEAVCDGSQIHCRFVHTGGGLVTTDGSAPSGFALCGEDNRWVWADALIHNDTVTVSSGQVDSPVNVRYAYAGNPVGNLCNAEGLPASPFTSEGPQLPTTSIAFKPMGNRHRVARSPVVPTRFHCVDASGRVVYPARGNAAMVLFDLPYYREGSRGKRVVSGGSVRIE